MTCWSILNISPTDDPRLIKKAYATKLREANPEDDPVAFKALREAYEEALGQHTPKKNIPQFPKTPSLPSPVFTPPKKPVEENQTPTQVDTLNALLREFFTDKSFQALKRWKQEGLFSNFELSHAFQQAVMEEFLALKSLPIALFVQTSLTFNWQSTLTNRGNPLRRPFEQLLNTYPHLFGYLEFPHAHYSTINQAFYEGEYQVATVFLDELDLEQNEQWQTYVATCCNAGTMGFGSFEDATHLSFGIGSLARPVKITSLPKYIQAIYANDSEVLCTYLQKGANPNLVIYPGLGPLHLAIKLGHNALMDPLLAAGADLDLTPGPLLYSPLFVAVNYQNKAAFDRLLELGVQDPPTAFHHTALMAAVYNNDLKMARRLVERGSNLHQAQRDKAFTLLYTAARYGHQEMLAYLLSLGLHPDWQPDLPPGLSYEYYAKTDVPFTPLTAALKNGDLKSVALLLQAGANPEKLANKTAPIDFAHSNPEMLDLLNRAF